MQAVVVAGRRKNQRVPQFQRIAGDIAGVERKTAAWDSA